MYLFNKKKKKKVLNNVFYFSNYFIRGFIKLLKQFITFLNTKIKKIIT